MGVECSCNFQCPLASACQCRSTSQARETGVAMPRGSSDLAATRPSIHTWPSRSSTVSPGKPTTRSSTSHAIVPVSGRRPLPSGGRREANAERSTSKRCPGRSTPRAFALATAPGTHREGTRVGSARSNRQASPQPGNAIGDAGQRVGAIEPLTTVVAGPGRRRTRYRPRSRPAGSRRQRATGLAMPERLAAAAAVRRVGSTPHRSSLLVRAGVEDCRNAFCGMSTLPIDFIRFAFLLLGPQLSLARDVAAIAFGRHVLMAKWFRGR